MKIISVFICFQCLFLFSGAQKDTTNNLQIEEVLSSKLDSTFNLHEIPKSVFAFLKSKCKEKFNLVSYDSYGKKYIRSRKRYNLNRFNFFLFSSQYYLIYYYKNSGVYHTDYLIILKHENKNVIGYAKLTGLFSEMISELKSRLELHKYSQINFCE